MKSYLRVFLCLLIAGQVIAAPPPITMKGTVTHTLNDYQKKNAFAKTHTKKIKLLKVALSTEAKTILKERISSLLKDAKNNQLMSSTKSSLPARVELGMNHVPVLDQGYHGTCVTFAVTAALDALLGQGDYISQLCHLTLGTHIANNTTYRPSGWDGSMASITLSRFSEYGIVSKAYEQSQGCAGLTEYPATTFSDPENEMSLVDYHLASVESEPFYEGEHFTYAELIGFQQRLLNQTSMTKIETDVKTALYQGDRVLMGVLLPMNESLGLEAKNHEEHDTWVLTGRTEYLAEHALWDLSQWGQWGGHELVITGYDDTSVVVDSDGKSHQGLFTLRNSWGGDVGDHGTFYMSYDYFRALAIDLVRIGNLSL